MRLTFPRPSQRFFAVSNVLSSMVVGLAKEPSVRLLKHIIRCYLRLSENIRARDALRHCLPGLAPSPAPSPDVIATRVYGLATSTSKHAVYVLVRGVTD